MQVPIGQKHQISYRSFFTVHVLTKLLCSNEREGRIFFYPLIGFSKRVSFKCTRWSCSLHSYLNIFLSWFLLVHARSKKERCLRSPVWDIGSLALSFSFLPSSLRERRGRNIVIIMASRGTSNNRVTGSTTIPPTNCWNYALSMAINTDKLLSV